MAQHNEPRTELVEALRSSCHILALLGAGLSASSGIPTFSDTGATWRGYESRTLATRETFQRDPRIVSEYYREFQQRVAAAAPNQGHLALAELAKAKPGFLAITQNIDGSVNIHLTHLKFSTSLSLKILQTYHKEQVILSANSLPFMGPSSLLSVSTSPVTSLNLTAQVRGSRCLSPHLLIP